MYPTNHKHLNIFKENSDQVDSRPFHPPVPAARRRGGYRGDGENATGLTGLLQDTQENVQHAQTMRFLKRMLNIRLTHGKRINRVTHV